MPTKKYSPGSAHVIIVVCLVVALVSALGFIFYQNFIKKPTDSTGTTNSTQSKNETTGKVVSLKEFTSQKYLLRFKYPSAWSISETIYTDDPAWYSSSVVVKNQSGGVVAQLGTGGQFGGACEPDAPTFTATTVIDSPITIANLETAHFGYTIVANENGSYTPYYGLNNGKLPLGTEQVQCPGMSVGYQYIVTAKDSPIGAVTFGSWAASSNDATPPFASFDAAKQYASSDEMKQIEAMITSLTIGQ